MATTVSTGPVNPAQVIAAMPGATTCTVRANDDEGTWDVYVRGKSVDEISAALAGIVYDPDVASVAEAG